MSAAEMAEAMYPESDITYGYQAVREAYQYGYAAAENRVPGMLSMKWDGGRCAVLDADRRIVGYLPPGRQAAGAAASALREAADGWSDWDAEGSVSDLDLITSAPTWLAELLAEVESLARWKTEALPVITGLQELGSALGIPLGKRITGPDALAAVKALTARAEAAEQAIQRVRDMPATPPSGGYYMVSMREVLRALDGGAS